MSTLEVKAIQAPSGYNLAMPAGSILQGVQGTTTSTTSTSSSSWAATTLSATITPKFSSSKILVTYSGSMYHYINTKAASTIYRDSTEVTGMSSGVVRSWKSNSRGFFPHGGEYLDSPSSTSAIVYKIYIKKDSGDYSVDYPTGADITRPTITLMEVAG